MHSNLDCARELDWLTPREAAGLMKVSVDLIYDACAKRALRHSRLGWRTIRIRREWLEQWAGSRSVGA
jgi:excisionase family DNA binding protein